MKLPALWIAASFAAGIALASRWPASPKVWAGAVATAILVAGILAWRDFAAPAWVLALAAWLALGGFATAVERDAIPANHVTRLIAEGRLDTTVPLRWRGRLREDPLLLPWGRRYQIDLEQVESAGTFLPAAGGLRAKFLCRPRAPLIRRKDSAPATASKPS